MKLVDLFYDYGFECFKAFENDNDQPEADKYVTAIKDEIKRIVEEL